MQQIANTTKKRNKNTNKSYNKHDHYENAVDMSSYINNLNYSTNFGKATNMSLALDSAHFSQHNSIGKQYENSFTTQ